MQKPTDTYVTVDAIARKNTKSKQPMKSTKPSSKDDEMFDCGRCGRHHGKKACPAFDQKCNKCDKKGHFSKVCRTKTRKSAKIHAMERNEQSSDTDSEVNNSGDLLGYQIKTPEDGSMSSEKICCNGKELTMKLDTGAQCNVLPSKLLRTLKAKLTKS